MEDNDDFETWKVCWEVARLFHVKRDMTFGYAVQCIGCGKKAFPWSATHRSELITLAVKCSAGHLDWIKTSLTDVCARCNQDFVPKLVKREQICPDDGCRRLLLVDEGVIIERLAGKPALAAIFLSLLERHKTFDCLIHGDMVQLSQVPRLSAATECNHEANICPKGLQETLEKAISEGRLQDIRCPDAECKAKYAVRDIRSIVSKESFADYNRRLSLRNMSKDPNFRWCRSVVNGRSCGNGQIIPNTKRELEWECVVCKSRNCFDCFPNMCPRHEKLRQDDSENRRKIQEITKKCPKRGCARLIERNKGCAHMTCLEATNGCGTEFCWNCKIIWKRRPGPYGRPIAAHLESCPLRHTSNPVTKPLLSDLDYSPGWDVDPGYDTSLDKDLWLPSGQS